MTEKQKQLYIKVKEDSLAEFERTLKDAKTMAPSDGLKACERSYLDARDALDRVRDANPHELADCEEMADKAFQEAHDHFRAL